MFYAPTYLRDVSGRRQEYATAEAQYRESGDRSLTAGSRRRQSPSGGMGRSYVETCLIFDRLIRRKIQTSATEMFPVLLITDYTIKDSIMSLYNNVIMTEEN